MTATADVQQRAAATALDDGTKARAGATRQTPPKAVLDRALVIIEAFRPDDDLLSLAQLVSRSGLAKSTAYRLADSLCTHGLLEREGLKYRLGLRLFSLGQSVPAYRHLRNVALPFLEELHESTKSIVHLAVLESDSLLVLDRVGVPKSEHPFARNTGVGDRLPAHSTAAGKVLLAYDRTGAVERLVRGGLVAKTRHTIVDPGVLLAQLTSIREQGLATAREETSEGVGAVAAPVIVDGKCCASIVAWGALPRFQFQRATKAVTMTATRIGRAVEREQLRTRDLP
jgi:DNA-binding IclR family transcriptional regulator